MTRRKHSFSLATGEEVIVRRPSVEKDLDRLVAFLTSLPAKERNCLRYNVTEVETCRQRLKQIDGCDHFRLIAELGGRIVGDATLDREPFAWTRHVAKIEAVTSHGHHEHEVTTILFRELATTAEEAHIERLFAEVMPEQKRVIAALEQCGFTREATLRKFARDLHGTKHDLLVFTTDLTHVWERLAELLEEMDVRIPA